MSNDGHFILGNAPAERDSRITWHRHQKQSWRALEKCIDPGPWLCAAHSAGVEASFRAGVEVLEQNR